ncbi:MAG: CsgG/HfaB family protein [Candidatus Tritonobacter lacicola]|nr:CsgG/HfaB family protein [Candidatus Tritonobacter lacicola]
MGFKSVWMVLIALAVGVCLAAPCTAQKMEAEKDDFTVSSTADEKGHVQFSAPAGTIRGGRMPIQWYLKVKKTGASAQGTIPENRSFKGSVEAGSKDKIYLELISADGQKEKIKLKTLDLARKSALRDKKGELRKDRPAWKGPKQIVKIDQFTNQAGAEGQAALSHNPEMAFKDALVNTGHFIVVGTTHDRKEALAEQDFAVSGRASGGKKIAKIGKLQLAQYVIKGAITGYASKTSGKSGGVGAYGFSIGGKGKKGYMEIAMSVVDTSTGTVVFSEKARGEPEGKGFSLGGGGGYFGVPVGGHGGAEKQDSADLIVQNCIDNAVDKLARKFATLPWKSSIAKVAGPKIYINGGERAGIKVGEKFKVVSLGEAIIDDDTGEILDDGSAEQTTKGVIEVIKNTKKLSICTAATGGPFEKGNTVVFKE